MACSLKGMEKPHNLFWKHTNHFAGKIFSTIERKKLRSVGAERWQTAYSCISQRKRIHHGCQSPGESGEGATWFQRRSRIWEAREPSNRGKGLPLRPQEWDHGRTRTCVGSMHQIPGMVAGGKAGWGHGAGADQEEKPGLSPWIESTAGRQKSCQAG